MIQSLTPTRWCATSLAKLAYIQVPIARLYGGIYDIYIYICIIYIYILSRFKRMKLRFLVAHAGCLTLRLTEVDSEVDG